MLIQAVFEGLFWSSLSLSLSLVLARSLALGIEMKYASFEEGP